MLALVHGVMRGAPSGIVTCASLNSSDALPVIKLKPSLYRIKMSWYCVAKYGRSALHLCKIFVRTSKR